MKAEGRVAAALFFSTLVHGAVLVSITARPSVPPETVQAGRLSVSLQGSSSEGGTTADDGTMPAPTPAEKKQMKAPEPVSPPDRQRANSADSEPGSAKAANESPGEARKSAQRTLAQIEPVAESSPATSSNPGRRKKAATEPGKTAPATARLHKAEGAADATHATESAETGNPPTVSADIAAPAGAPSARKAVRARLEGELARHFHYPFLARRRGWEGKVVLRVRIDGRGRIDSTEIAESSGHGILDRAALDAVAKVALIPGAAERLGGIGLYLELPVIYRLREG